MNNVINLNKFRKQKKKDAAEQNAQENREKFGRSAQEKDRDEAEQKKLQKHLDDREIDDSDQ